MIFANIALSSIAFLSALVGYGATVMAAKRLGVESIGEFYRVAFLIAYFDLFTGTALPLIAQRQLARRRDVATWLISNVANVQIIAALILSASCIAGGWTISENSSTHWLFFILGAGIFVNALSFRWALQARQLFIVPALIGLGSEAFRLLSTAFLVHSEKDLLAYACLSVAGIALTTLATNLFAAKNGLFHFRVDRLPRLRLSRALIASSLPIGLSHVAIMVYFYSDALILGWSKGSVEVGYYATAYSLMVVLLAPSNAILSVFFPLLSQARQNDDVARRRSKLFVLSMAWTGIPISMVVWVFGQQFFEFLYGTEFAIGSSYFRWLAPNIALVYLNMSVGNSMIAWGHQRLHMKITLGAALLNLLLNGALVPVFSGHGAIAATVGTEAAVFLAILCARRRKQIVVHPILVLVAPPVLLFIGIQFLCTRQHPIISAGAGLLFVALAALIAVRQQRTQVTRGTD